MNNQIVTPAADSVARVSIAGYHSIISVVYDKANSTLSNSLNSVVYFQTANVDSLVSTGNITGGNISTTGNVTAAYFIGNGSLLTGISATANTGNVSFNDVTIQGVTSYSGLNISASPEDTANLKYLRIRSGDADSHIHFDSGNNSQYDLIFGDDSKYLMVSNTGNVVISTYQNYANSWTFGSNGKLTFPDATVQATAWTGIPGPYADDEAAALAGVALGSPYHKTGTGGQVFVRLTSPT
jgi:hypothetical protein